MHACLPTSTGRLNRFVTLKSNLRPSSPLSPAMCISLSTTNQSHLRVLGAETIEEEKERKREPENSKDVHRWGPRGGERMRLTTGAELKQLCEIQPQSEKTSSHSLYEMRSRLLCSCRRCRAAVATKLRLYREYSIKLMLAWETCCRSRSPFLGPIPLFVGLCFADLYSPGIRYPVFVPATRNHCGCPGRCGLRLGIGAAFAHLCRSGSHTPSQVPRWLRLD